MNCMSNYELRIIGCFGIPKSVLLGCFYAKQGKGDTVSFPCIAM